MVDPIKMCGIGAYVKLNVAIESMIKFEWQRIKSHKDGTSCFIVSVLVSKYMYTKIFLAHLIQRTMSAFVITLHPLYWTK